MLYKLKLKLKKKLSLSFKKCGENISETQIICKVKNCTENSVNELLLENPCMGWMHIFN